MNLDARPVLAPHVHLYTDPLTGKPLLLFREDILELNEEAEAIVSRCDGTARLSEIIGSLAMEYDAEAAEIQDSVLPVIDYLSHRRLLLANGPARRARKTGRQKAIHPSNPGRYRPYVLLAELTYRCPLHCPYCSNPVRYPKSEISTADWARVFREAASLGVLHAGLSGGEPLQRPDLPEIVCNAVAAGLYPNLISSGIGLTPCLARELRDAGLESIQLSFQADEPDMADRLAGAKVHQAKLRAAAIIQETGMALSMNVVLHRENIDRIEQVIAFAESQGVDRLELANTQYYGWAFKNRFHLLPTRAQAEAARGQAEAAQRRLAGQMEIFYVLPDLYETRPKPCMQGWGHRYLTVNPAGDVLPCPTAAEIPGLRFDNVRDRDLEWIWVHSESFNRFRGTDWMPAPCRECPRREIDFGGCRCQAALLANDPGATDPVCTLSPNRHLVDRILDQAAIPPPETWQKRLNPCVPGPGAFA